MKVEAGYHVTIFTYDMELLRPQDGSIELKFNLDPETLELSQPQETRVIYHPEGLDPDDYFTIDARFEFQRVAEYGILLGQ